MPTDPHAAITGQLIDWLLTIPGAAEWNWFDDVVPGFESGRCCAVWWAGDEVYEPASTTGWMGIQDVYQVRYWEPSSAPSRVTPDGDPETLGLIQQQVRQVIFAHPELPASSLASAYQMLYAGARRLGPADGASDVRGFEIAVTVRRAEAYA